MSTSQKPRGGTNSELTRFKLLWRDSLAESARDFWRALFISATKQSDIRAQLLTKLKIKLHRDDQLTAFRAWLEEQDQRDTEAERQSEDERRLTEQFGDSLTKDQIREKVLAASYARTLATGNFELGLATIKQDVNVQAASLDRDKFEFDAAKAALAHAAELKTISNNSKLSEPEKVNLARAKLFGVLPPLK